MVVETRKRQFCAQSVRKTGLKHKTSASAKIRNLGKSAGQGRRLGDLNPGWAVDPNRISSATG
jgi:hypothetical protein